MAAEPRRPHQPARPVLVGDLPDDHRRALESLAGRADDAAADVRAAIALATEAGASLPQPGAGSTPLLWSALATLGATDLTVARVLEPHLDALAILDQAGVDAEPGAWGVYAAEGPGHPLQGRSDGSSWTLSGRKHWCSLAGSLDRALITAWVGEDARPLRGRPAPPGGHRPSPARGPPGGCPKVDCGPVALDAVPADGLRGQAGTSPGPASPGAASASPRSGTAARSASRAGCWSPRPAVVSPTRSRCSTSAPSTPCCTPRAARWPTRPRPSTPAGCRPGRGRSALAGPPGGGRAVEEMLSARRTRSARRR